MERDEDPRAGFGRGEEGTYRGPGDVPGPRVTPAEGELLAAGGRPVDPETARRRRGVTEEDGAEEGDEGRPGAFRDPWAVRAEDTEPYVGLQYVARLFKIVAMVVIVALTAEIVAAFATEGTRAFLPLFVEVIQGGVLAAILWGASDLTLLFIDVGHDVRAARVLLGRMSARMDPVGHGPEDRVERGVERKRFET
jgi:hypothetical protein